MISDQTALEPPQQIALQPSAQTALQPSSGAAATRAWRTPGGSRWLTAIAAMISRLGGAIKRSAKAPLRPYATLWEASVLVAIVKDREYLEPDPFATEMPFVSDVWLHS